MAEAERHVSRSTTAVPPGGGVRHDRIKRLSVDHGQTNATRRVAVLRFLVGHNPRQHRLHLSKPNGNGDRPDSGDLLIDWGPIVDAQGGAFTDKGSRSGTPTTTRKIPSPAARKRTSAHPSVCCRALGRSETATNSRKPERAERRRARCPQTAAERGGRHKRPRLRTTSSSASMWCTARVR